MNIEASTPLQLPYANDPAECPGSNWATSYRCDTCGCADYDQIHAGNDIMPFYRDTDTGYTICWECVKKGEKE
jgi:hypothetical protein